MQIMLRRNECRLNFKNRPVRTGDIKGVLNNPLPLIGVARSLPLIGLRTRGIDSYSIVGPKPPQLGSEKA